MKVEYDIQKQQVHCMNYDQPWQACILPTNLPYSSITTKQSAFMTSPPHFTS